MPSPAVLADPLRLAYWHSTLTADGPGVVFRDLRDGSESVSHAITMIRDMDADILVLGGLDYDHGAQTLGALRDRIGPEPGAGASSDPQPTYPHHFTAPPNAGVPTGLDLDGNGRWAEARDAQGYGRFPGQGGMAVLSRWPITLIADHSAQLWADVPDSLMIDAKGRTGPDATGWTVQRLSSVVHWEVQVEPPGTTPLRLMVFNATPPVFDGPEDRNGRRNADEILFWQHRLDGALGPAPTGPYALIGTFNLDPDHGQGRHHVMRDLLADPRVQDPEGLSGTPTADWPPPGPGPLRVDYILPSAGLRVLDASVIATDPEVSRHFPVVVTLDMLQAVAN